MQKIHQPSFSIWKAAITLIFLLSVAIPNHMAAALPSPILVNSISAFSGSNGNCELNEALQAAFNANNNNASSTVDACTANPGPIVIAFSPALTGQTIHLDGNDLPWIHDNTTIEGVGISIDGGGSSKDLHVFRLAPGASFNLVGMTITNAFTSGSGPAIFDSNQGSINLVGVNLVNNHAGTSGGAIESNGNLSILTSNLTGNWVSGGGQGVGYGGAVSFSGGGTLNISKSNFTGNQAVGVGGGALWISSTYNATSDIADTLFTGNTGSEGGAIYNGSTASGALLRISRSAFSGNSSASGSGGAIWSGLNGKIDFSDSSFNLNVAQGSLGGAIYSQSSYMTVTRGAFIANSAANGSGGAIALDDGGYIYITNTMFSANSAPLGSGGAIYAVNIQGSGPASRVKILNSTLASNSAKSAGKGGGIYVSSGQSVQIGNTILASSSGGNCAGSVTSLGHNLDDGTTCALTSAGDLANNAHANLSGPGFNGGPITSLLSIKLLSGSAAIDAGDAELCIDLPVAALDQRGKPRPTDGDGDGTEACDIGSYEVEGAVPGFGSTPGQPGPIALGTTKAGAATAITTILHVFNTGQGILKINSAVVGGTDASTFGVVTATPITMPGGGTANITLSCKSATADTTKTATLTLTTNDPTHASVVYNLTCNVGAADAAGYASDPIPHGPLVFPAVVPGDTSKKSLTMKEVGALDLTVSNPVFSGANKDDFSIDFPAFPLTIADGDPSVPVTLSCTPADIGLRSATLTFTTNDPSQHTVYYNLSCPADPPPSPPMAVGHNLLPPVFMPANFGSPNGIAISPDSQNAYVTSRTSGFIEVFNRTNFLGIRGFFAFGQVQNSDLEWAQQIAVAPDGKSVFAVGYANSALVMYTRDPSTGALSKPVSWKDGVSGVTGMNYPRGVAISPDSNFIYVSSMSATSTQGGVAIFKRGISGSYAFLSSLTDADILGANGLTVSPDGASVYVTAYLQDLTKGNLVVFKRNLISGTLSKIQTRSQGDTLDCFLPPFCSLFALDGMKNPYQVVVSPDGASVYTVSDQSDAVVGFKRDLATGKLIQSGIYLNNVNGVKGLNGGRGIAISPDGAHVYTAGFSDKAVSVFDRDILSGALSFNSLFQRNPLSGTGGTPPLDGANGIAASPDGQIVLAIAFMDQAVVEFDYASPIATLKSLAPASATPSSPAFMLVVHGSGFVNGSTVRWNGSARATNYINANEVHAAISAADVAAAGTFLVRVDNPSPGGGPSNNTLKFIVPAANQNPVASIDSISPMGAMAGTNGLIMDVYGTNFLNNGDSTVLWNGLARTTTYFDHNHLRVALSINDLAQPGLTSISVLNAAPGGGTSNAMPFEIAAAGTSPVPTIFALSPGYVLSHGGASTPTNLTVDGQNFVEGASVQVNGLDRPTTFVNAGRLVAILSSDDLAEVGSAVISVSNPAPGGGQSNSMNLTINAGALPPLLSNLSFQPGSGTQINLLFTGKYFTNLSIAQINGVDQPTTFISATQVRITINKVDMAKALSARFTVYNPYPDYSMSNPITLTPVYLPLVRK